MSRSPDMTALYNRPVVLWVEDQVQSTYLDECWNDADIAFRIAGGNQGVRTIVRSAREEGFAHVFGFVDRDFGSSNRARWHDAHASAVFTPEVHEVENYFLTSDHLAGCDLNNGHRSATEIEERLQRCAGGMVWGMAYRQVLVDLRAEIIEGFPGHSRVTDLATAENLICGSDWFQRLDLYMRKCFNAENIKRKLTDAHKIAANSMASGEWRQMFSGKDLLHDLHSWLYNPPPGGATTAAERDRDLARSIAKFQVAGGVVPVEVVELHRSLRGRVGI